MDPANWVIHEAKSLGYLLNENNELL